MLMDSTRNKIVRLSPKSGRPAGFVKRFFHRDGRPHLYNFVINVGSSGCVAADLIVGSAANAAICIVLNRTFYVCPIL